MQHIHFLLLGHYQVLYLYNKLIYISNKEVKLTMFLFCYTNDIRYDVGVTLYLHFARRLAYVINLCVLKAHILKNNIE